MNVTLNHTTCELIYNHLSEVIPILDDCNERVISNLAIDMMNAELIRPTNIYRYCGILKLGYVSREVEDIIRDMDKYLSSLKHKFNKPFPYLIGHLALHSDKCLRTLQKCKRYDDLINSSKTTLMRQDINDIIISLYTTTEESPNIIPLDALKRLHTRIKQVKGIMGTNKGYGITLDDDMFKSISIYFDDTKSLNLIKAYTNELKSLTYHDISRYCSDIAEKQLTSKK